MADVICNTSPLQYLHQIGCLHILPSMVQRVVVPPAVVEELLNGRSAGVDVPDISTLDWVIVKSPASISALPLIHDLGAGETEVLMLAMEFDDCVVIMDERLGRREARNLKKAVKGTLGLLLDAKRAGLIPAIRPLLEKLDALGFRLSERTRAAVLALAGEE